MAHCCRCLIPWGGDSGRYLMEVDRVLRPGGFWVVSGPPINWKTNFKSWQRPREDLEREQRNIEETAKLLCWEKKYEKGETAIWRKGVNTACCKERDSRVNMCKTANPDDFWYKQMEECVTPYPETSNSDDVSGGELKSFPERLNDVPPRITSGSVLGRSVEFFQKGNRSWKLCCSNRASKIMGYKLLRENIMPKMRPKPDLPKEDIEALAQDSDWDSPSVADLAKLYRAVYKQVYLIRCS